jgi:hypothetical protein
MNGLERLLLSTSSCHFDSATDCEQVHSLDGTEPSRSRNEVEVAKRLRIVRDYSASLS